MRLALAAAIAVAALAVPTAAQAATYTVAKGGGSCGGTDRACESLNAAAGAVAAGDAVQVEPGVYDEAPTFTVPGVTITGSTTAPGVVVTGTMSFTGSGSAPSVLERLIVAPSSTTSPAVGVSGSAGVAVRDAFLLSAAGSVMTIAGGAGNELTRSTVVTGAAAGKAVDIQTGAAGASLLLSSSIISGGANGTGVAVKTGVGTLVPGSAGSVSITARHVTIAGSANAFSLDASSATGLLNTPAGNIIATVTDSIVLGANPRAANAGVILVAAPNAATLSVARTDQSTPADQLFANAGRRNFHLRPDAPAIDKAQVTSGDSATDVDGQPRVNGPASDQGADEFHNSTPQASFAVTTPAPKSGRPVTFDASASTDREGGIGGGIVQYQWNFGDGTTESTTTPTVSHTYSTVGNVAVSLVVVDRQGAASPPAVVPVSITDGTPPSVVISIPKPNQRVKVTTTTTKTVTKDGKKRKVKTTKRTRVGFGGTAKDASGVTTVYLTIQRLSVAKAKKKAAAKSSAAKSTATCIWLDPKRGFVSRNCQKPILIKAKFKDGKWAYLVASRIKFRAGTYRVSAYGTDGAGAFGNSAPAAKRVVRFTLTA
ncbi:MAG TPA: PKD domain-containing protein [Solirubrobacteraceae bacterium]|nr:PKD domain-containing protein [Solirubrobacteraceae bacterium]